ncbi:MULTISPECIES: hypothetical protein [Chromobacterium]|nr:MULTISPECIES: hypothetical protein [Chromobacterium]
MPLLLLPALPPPPPPQALNSAEITDTANIVFVLFIPVVIHFMY